MRPGQRRRILIVEDNKGDVFLIREALKIAKVDAEIYVVNNGKDATNFFDEADRDRDAPCPNLVLLDLNLPRKSGDQVLQHLRDSRRCRNARVLIVTSSDLETERQVLSALGATGYFRKPTEYAQFLKLGPIVKELLDERF
jgi:chemotaxis family two-component system response regulator Rcp1